MMRVRLGSTLTAQAAHSRSKGSADSLVEFGSGCRIDARRIGDRGDCPIDRLERGKRCYPLQGLQPRQRPEICNCLQHLLTGGVVAESVALGGGVPKSYRALGA